MTDLPWLLPALCLAALAGLGLALLLWTRALSRRLDEMERARRRQFSELASRVERANQRMNQDLQMANQLLQISAQGSEERMERLLSRMTLALDQQQRQMKELRQSVDGQLQQALENRLGDSFRQVREQLERVYKGLGEMQRLAGSVGDLKKVLAGVKTRGIWGETRLAALLEENLTPEQYLADTPVEPGAKERVEFALRLPGRGQDAPVLLPIDAKFPLEDYERLQQASQEGDKEQVDKCAQALERSVLTEAKRIAGKYIRPPYTTDFAVLFLPTEGLYAEALRRPGLAQRAQREYHILLAGPTTLSALLTSLQTGFQTLAVEQRSREIWRLLGSVRAEFTRFGELLDRTRQRLAQAGAELDAAASRSRSITRELNRIDTLPQPGAPLEEAPAGPPSDAAP
ncbi:MAG TPA: DNA recombination protein RmuC [Candidatus Excrementavichristensenella intestinipullorum]|nr:DNA recombination protein RmuC [Candidatus Excrementavichristensenella intestinipullorum]